MVFAYISCIGRANKRVRLSREIVYRYRYSANIRKVTISLSFSLVSMVGFFFFASTSSPPFSASGRFAYPLLLLLRLLQFQLAVNRKHSLVCNVKVIMCAASVNIEECCVGNRLTKRGRWFTEWGIFVWHNNFVEILSIFIDLKW